MDIEMLTAFFGWCSVINLGILIYWVCFLRFCPNWTYEYSIKWISVSREQFNAIHFSLIGGFKLAVFLLNIVPYFALRIIA